MEGRMAEIDIPYGDEVVADTYAAIDALIAKHPSRAKQALEKPVLQGWFAGQVMKKFGGYGDFAGICQMVSERLEALRQAQEQG
jgi:aspartyl-tRNA(Asn)/glutamyl-tRNA(Gln) amidotransferase subunit B